jgi:hypothetical protein
MQYIFYLLVKERHDKKKFLYIQARTKRFQILKTTSLKPVSSLEQVLSLNFSIKFLKERHDKQKFLYIQEHKSKQQTLK